MRKVLIVFIVSALVNVLRAAMFPVKDYQVASVGNNEIYQVYDTVGLTRPEAETVCRRCTNGVLPIITSSEIYSFVLSMLANNGILSGRVWLGLQYVPFQWKWDNNSNISYHKWEANHPVSGTKYGELDIVDGYWYSQSNDHRQSEQSFVMCQYTSSDVGQYETDWSIWDDCDVLSEKQVRTRLCLSPATPGGGCTCEDYQTEFQDCVATSVMIEPNGNSLYQLYDANVNWYEADEVCRRCESGTIVTQHTKTEKDFIVDNLMAGYGWFESYFVGLFLDTVTSIWLWIDLVPLTWDNWAMLNPSSDVTKSVACATKLSWHQWYSCRKEDRMDALVCKYTDSGQGTFGSWQSWGPCMAMPGIGAGMKMREKRCISPVNKTVQSGCDCHDVARDFQACTTALKAIYNRSDDVYTLFEASGTGSFSETLCTDWCTNTPGTLVQYQTQEKYEDILNNLIRTNLPINKMFGSHFIGLSDERYEGVWRWLDRTQLPGDWAFWEPGEPRSGFLKSYVMLHADTTPRARTALRAGTTLNDLADFVVCEYLGVGINGLWSSWSAWGSCTILNTQTRSRTCNLPAPTMSGCQCTGTSTEEQPCNYSATTTTTTTTTTPTTTTQLTTTTTTPVSSTTHTTPSTTTIPNSLPSHTSTSTTSGSTTTQSSTTDPNQCYCSSLCEEGHLNLTLEEKLAKLILDLTLDKDSLSSVRRKKVSADDDRISAKSIGITGCVVLICIFMIIVVIDFRRLVISSKYVMNCLKQDSETLNDHRVSNRISP